jgi:hypothetical protein
MNDDFERMRRAFEPLQRISEMVKPFQKIAEQMAKFQLLVERPVALIDTQLQVFRTAEFQNQIQGAIQHHQKLQQISAELGSRLLKIVEKTPDSILLLAHYSWYLDYDSEFSLPIWLAEMIEQGEIDKVDAFLVNEYSERFDRIIEDLASRHPKREKILTEIALVYKAGFYHSVITSTLSQVDGICNDITQKKFFLKKKDKQSGDYLSEVSNDASELAIETFLPPFTKPIPISAHESILNNFPCTLNRHTIMHGIDITYGTRINALKCISLLKYVSDVLSPNR